MIDSRVEAHDRNQFEVKLDYTTDAEAKRDRYRVEAYFFIPRSLGVNPHTYSRAHFYSDVQAYIRFKTPEFTFQDLLDPNNDRSPFNRLRGELSQNGCFEGDVAQLSQEFKLLGCILRARIQDRAGSIQAQLAKFGGSGDLESSVDRLVTELGDSLRTLRSLNLEHAPQRLREAFAYVDEYLSLVCEMHLTHLVQSMDRSSRLGDRFQKTRERLTVMLLAERSHRCAKNYLTVLEEGSEEHFVYRQGMLKKYVMSVLFLEITKERQGRRLLDVMAAVAAGIAMTFSTVAAIWSQEIYGINSFPFVMALVVSYMFKDRIKEWLRRYFSHKITPALADYDLAIHDPESDDPVGRCRETFAFVNEDQIPVEVLEKRHIDNRSSLEAESKPEVIIRYSKDIDLKGSIIRRLHGRLRDITDIIRFNLARFLLRADDPQRKIRRFNAETDRVDSIHLPKLYHINVVFVLRTQKHPEAQTVERVRVIVDRSGIKRLESVDGFDADAS